MGTIHPDFSDYCAATSVLVDLGIWDQATADELAAWVCSAPTPYPESRRVIHEYLVAFLGRNLAGDPRYQNILTGGYALAREPLIELFVTERRSPSSIDQDWPNDFLYFMHQPGSEQARAEKNPKAVKGAVERAWQRR